MLLFLCSYDETILKKSITATVAHIAENMLEASIIFILQLNTEKFSQDCYFCAIQKNLRGK